MRILMVNKYLYPRAGAETYMLELTRLLKSHGHTVAFFGMDHPDKTDLGPTCTIDPVSFDRGNSKVKNIVELCKAVFNSSKVRKKFEKFCEWFRPDLIHAHNVYNQISPSLFENTKVPVIMTAHDYKAVCPSYNLFSNGENCVKCLTAKSFKPCVENKCIQGSLVKSILAAMSSARHKKKKTYEKLYDRIIAPSHFMKKKLVEGGLQEDKIDVVHNFTKGKRSLYPSDDFLLYAGRICIEKGVHTLIEAYENIQGKKPQLKICGTGPLKPVLEKYTKEKNLDIEWLGYVKPEKVKKLILSSKAVLVPSIWYENCSMTIMESLVLGKPVIASTSGGNNELINDGYNGFKFEGGNVQSLIDALTKFLHMDYIDLEANSYHFGQTFFGPDTHYKSILKVYEKVIGIHSVEEFVSAVEENVGRAG